jgi:glucokinase-like ROK family protein
MRVQDPITKLKPSRYTPEIESEQESHILSLVREADGLSRADLVESLGIGRSTLELLLGTLMARGLIQEAGAGQSHGGRRPRLLVFRKESGYIVSVDLGATSVDVAITNLNAEILVHKTRGADVRRGPEPVLADIERLIREAVAESGIDRSLLRAIGMGVPGPVEFRTGHPVSPPIMPGWHRFNIRAYLEDRFHLPVFVDNDVNIMALGERWAGLGRQVENFIFVKVGSGVGCGIVCRGQIYRGVEGCAGDIGHVEVTSEPIPCRCGRLGCLEALVGGIALARQAEEAARDQMSPILAQLLEEKGSLTVADTAYAVQQGDPFSLQMVHSASSLIGRTLASIVNFFNPSLIILGGGVANLGGPFLSAIREVVYQRSLPLATEHLVIQRSVLQHEAGVVGAAAMVLYELYKITPRRDVEPIGV